jgi:hypothetical protein
MKVVWQFTARGCKKPNPSVGNGMIGWEGAFLNLNGEPVSRPTQTVPYGTGLFVNAFLAVNCQATFI